LLLSFFDLNLSKLYTGMPGFLFIVVDVEQR